MVYVLFCSVCYLSLLPRSHQKPLANCCKCVLKDVSLTKFFASKSALPKFCPPPLLIHNCYLWVAPWDITITNTPTSRLSKEAVFRFCWEISKSKTVPVDYANTVYKFAFTTITKGSDKPATQLLSSSTSLHMGFWLIVFNSSPQMYPSFFVCHQDINLNHKKVEKTVEAPQVHLLHDLSSWNIKCKFSLSCSQRAFLVLRQTNSIIAVPFA